MERVEEAGGGDPRFDLSTRRGQVFVTVHRPPEGAAPLDLADVHMRLGEWPLGTRDTRALARAVRAAEGRPTPCGTLLPAGQPGDDAPFAVVLSPAVSRPFLVPWATPEAPSPEREAVHKALLVGGLPGSLADTCELPEGEWSQPLAFRAAPARGGSPGGFDVDWQAGTVLVAVTTPAGGGLAVRRDDVASILEEVPGVVIDEDALARALAEATGEPVAVARLQPTAVPDPDGAAVCITEDGLAAYLAPWSHDHAQPLPAEAAAAALAAAGVSHGVDAQALAAMAEGPFDRPRLAARGMAAEHGRDATVQFLDPGHVGIAGRHVPHVLADGRIDYHDLGEECTVTSGAILAVKTPAVPAGRPGRSVRGEELAPRPGKDIPLARHAGKGTRVSDDGGTLLALTGGLVVWSGNKLHVMTVRTIPGDVDFRTGNVIFDGSVVVRGNVKGGFRVQATGAIEVNGEVADAVLDSDGDVRVNGGIVGAEGVVRAGGALKAGYLHSVDVDVAGPVTINSEVWQCRVVSGDTVRVNGRIVGGEVLARKAVVAHTFGAAVGTATAIEVGPEAPPTEEVRSQPGFRPAVAVATKAVHAGVTVTIHGFRRDVERKLPAVTFREQGGEIQSLAGARLP